MTDLAQQCEGIRGRLSDANPDDVQILLAYIYELQSELAAMKSAYNAMADGGTEFCNRAIKAEAELAALRRPAAESEEVRAARIRDRNSLSAWFDGEARSHAEDAYRDRRALLAALDHSELEKALAGESWRDLMDACGLDPENTIIEQVAQLVNDLRSQLSAREAEIGDLQCTSAMIVDAESRRLAAEAAEQEALSRLAAKDAEIASLKSPPEERTDIVDFVEQYCEPYPPDSRVPLLVGYCKELLRDCARYRNAHTILKSDNARLTAANSEYTQRHLEMVEKCQKLEKEAQGLRGANARYHIEIQLAEECLDADFEAGSMDMEYWHDLHDRIIGAARENIEMKQRIERLEGALRELIRGYVRTLESARDRIIDYGGQCDPVEVMDRSDANLKAARAALAVADGHSEAKGE